MIPGVKIQLGDKEFEIPPLSLGMLRSGLMEKMQKHDEMLKNPDMNANDLLLLRGEIIFAALKRNYPEMDESDAFERLDYGNVSKAWAAILGLSGFVGEALETTQADPATVSSRTTLPSPPPMDGPEQ